MSYFNEDQEDYMRQLNKIPAESKCYCGWYRLGECVVCPPDKTNADKLREQATKEGKVNNKESSIDRTDGAAPIYIGENAVFVNNLYRDAQELKSLLRMPIMAGRIEEAAQRIASLERENAELRKDKERLEALWECDYLAAIKDYVASEDWPMRHQIDFILKKLHSSNAATKAEAR